MTREGEVNTSRLKPWIFRAGVVAIPVLFILVLEVSLRAFGVGEAARTPFVPVEGRREYVSLSPDFGRRYFTAFVPSVAFNPFKPQKPARTFRVFVLGGSSAAGFPYSFYYGFPARLQARLESFLPDLRIEVINLGMTAVNSYTLWHLKDYLLRYDPDAIAIYAGHNEYYGAFGAGSSMYSLGNRVWLKRLTLKLKGSALYSLLERLIVRPPRGTDAVAARSRTMMAQVVGDRSIELGDDVYRAGVDQFKRNLADVLSTFREAGVPVYLATLTANLRSQPPLGDNPLAREAFEEGNALMASDGVAALQAYMRASDLDDIRFRAPQAMNDVIRGLAEAPGVTLVDVHAKFRENAAGGVEGGEQFVDHLHPAYAGYDAMAETFFEAMIGRGPLETMRRLDGPSNGVAIDPIDRATSTIQVIRLKSGFPYRKDVEPEEEMRLYSRLLDRFLRSGSYTDSLAVLALNQVRPIYDLLYEGIRTARSRTDTLSALLMYRALLNWQPFNDDLNREAVTFALNSPRWDSLSWALASSVFNRLQDPDYLDALAAIRLRQGRLDEARYLLSEVELRNPSSLTMLSNMTRLHMTLGDTALARQYYTRLQEAAQNR